MADAIQLQGTHTALATPMADREIDYVSLQKLIQTQMDAGIEGVLAVGTTGESPTLSHEEHSEVVRKTVEFAKVVQVFAIVLGPVAIGMWLRSRFPHFAERMQKPVKIVSALFLLLIILLAVAKDWRTFVEYAPAVGGAALAFNLLSMAVGYCVPRLLKLDLRQAIAIAMEIGIHNGTLAIALALSPALLNNPTMAIPAAIYSLIMFVTAALFGLWVNRVHGAELVEPLAQGDGA